MRSVPVLFLLLALVTGLTKSAVAVGPLVAPRNNVLVIVGDDVGIDVLRSYDPNGEYGILDLPPTPNLDALAARGVRFTNVWSNPACCPTRATIQTGRYGFRNGILHIVPMPPHDASFGIDLEAERLIPRVLHDILGASRVSSAAIGKWHLSTGPAFDDQLTMAPNEAGYEHFSGTLFNVGTSESYFDWDRTDDGLIFRDSRYATSANVDDALSWISERTAAGTPWFLWLAFNAPHAPYHVPPASLHTRNLAGVDCGTNPRPCFLAMLEAMDSEIGRLLAGLEALPGDVDENTTILFIGDNGTPKEVTVAPFLPSHAKQTLYEGGVRVPLIAAGYPVTNGGRVSDALVNATDVYASVLELMVGRGYRSYLRRALGDNRPIDAVSFVPILQNRVRDIRDFAFAETKLIGANGKLIRELERDVDGNPVSSYKLILFAKFEDTPQDPAADDFEISDIEFYELLSDPFERVNLLLDPLDPAAAEVYERLCGRVRDLCGVDIVCDVPTPRRTGGRGTADLGQGRWGTNGESSRAESRTVPGGAESVALRMAVSPSPSVGRTRLILSGQVARLHGAARIALYDVGGRCLCEIWKGDAGSLPSEFTWEGTDERGTPFPSGTYLARVEVGGTPIAAESLTLLH